MTAPRNRCSQIAAIGFAIGVFGGASSAWATPAYDNISGLNSTTFALSSQNVASPSGPLAASFHVNSNFKVSDIQLELSASKATGSFIVFLANQTSSGTPNVDPTSAYGTLTVNDSQLSSSASPFDWALSSPVTLNAGTYWVVAKDNSTAPATTSAVWWQDVTDSGQGVAGQQSYQNATLSSNDGGYQFLMAVNGSSVPEPTGLAVIGSGLLGLVMLRNRRGAKRRPHA